MSRLMGKICLITGAASGIGEASARMFSEEGAEVIALDIDQAQLAVLRKTMPGIEIHTVDVCSAKAVEQAIEDIGDVDVLFNCAGMVSVGSVLECNVQDWQSSFDLNVSGIYHTIRAVLPGMLKKGSGSIINMSSVISSLGAAPERFAYGATKAAVIGMTRSVSRDFAHRGIRCNAICPSAVDTPSMSARINQMSDPDAARLAFNARQPVGRMGRCEEIAHLAVYLASDESRFTTGSSIVIDGGTRA